MTVRELRDKYLRFFESKGHTIYPSGSLIPVDVTGRLDESLLFNGAGMVQFKPYFRGVAEPPNKRLTTAQKCVRTGDIDEVGNLSHLTFFEMMGNFSFGDYFKKEAVAFSWEFLTSKEWLGLDPQRLSFTVFEEDDEVFGYWAEHFATVGIDARYRVFRLGEDTNYWPAGAFSKGPPGPCGPNSEMFYWTASTPPPGEGYTREQWLADDEAKNWLEIWNDVFIQFEWQGQLRNPDRPADGFEKTGMPSLPFQSIDTGMGLERTAAVLGGFKSVYDTDAFQPILKKIQEISGSEVDPSDPNLPTNIGGKPLNAVPKFYRFSFLYGQDENKDRAARIISDHIRTACFCIADGVLPGNSGRGYVLRRLIRRAVLKGQRVLGFEEPFFHRVFEGVLESMGDHYGELVAKREVIVETLRGEEALFRRTLTNGQQQLEMALYGVRSILKQLDLCFSLVYENRPQLSELQSLFDAHGLYGGNLSYGVGQSPPADFKVDFASLTKPFAEALLDHKSLAELEEIKADALTGLAKLPGSEAFKLYDTFGFPFEVTKELSEEAGVKVDEEGYELALKEAQERSRGGTERESVYGGVQISIVTQIIGSTDSATPTKFLGYDTTQAQTEVSGAIHIPGERDPSQDAPEWPLAIALKETPFYAESGGQVSDTGILIGGGFEGRVTDVIKQDGVFVHEVEPIKMPVKDPTELTGLVVDAEVDQNRRARITRNHTATHLLHAALRQVLGRHVTQAGSYVGPDRLRFDFTHGQQMTEEQKAEVEKIVNAKALENLPVITYDNLPIAEAKAMGAMALFGEKYGNFVRLVQVGDEKPNQTSFSRELCGGIHVRTTGEIGLFKIVSEASAASGVRRIEALTGEGAYEWVLEQSHFLKEAADKLKSTPKDLLHSIEKHLEQLKHERRERENLERRGVSSGSARESGLVQHLVAKGFSAEYELEKNGEKRQVDAGIRIGDNFLLIEIKIGGDERIAASKLDELTRLFPESVALLAYLGNDTIKFVCKVGQEALQKGAHAGNLVREVAKIAGGGGGGRPDFATAGGKDASKVAEALATAEGVLKGMLS
jgi:alanyl-tRNA synthetase